MTGVYLSVSIYVLSLLIISWLFKNNKSKISFVFAGRKLTLPVLIATLVSTWYGGILAIGEFSIQHGIVTFLVFGIPYYIAAFIYAVYMVPKIYCSSSLSIPENISNYFGKIPGLLSALIILLVSSPAPYVFILAQIANHFLGFSFLLSSIVISLFALIYTYVGGFKSVVLTDMIQFIIIYIGFIAVFMTLHFKAPLYLNQDRSIFLLYNNIKDTYLFSVPGSLSWSYIISWFFISFVTFIDPSFYQRIYSGCNIRTVQKSIFISIFFWIIFDLFAVGTALYIHIIAPEINVNPFLYILSSDILPQFLKTIFFISLISVVISTIDSYYLISGFTLSNDIFKSQSIKSIRIGMIFTSAVSIFLVHTFESAINLWYVAGSYGVSCLLVPLIVALFKLNRVKAPNLLLLTPFIITTLWFLYGLSRGNYIYAIYPLNLEPMYPGLLSSVLLYLSIRTSK